MDIINKLKDQIETKDKLNVEALNEIQLIIEKWNGLPPEEQEDFKGKLPMKMALFSESARNIIIDEISMVGILKKDILRKKVKEARLLLKIDLEEGEEDVSKQKFNPRPYSNKILEKYPLKYDLLKRFWIYHKESGLWIDNAEPILNSLLRKMILGTKDYKTYCVREIMEDLKGLALVMDFPIEPKPYLIPFNNKIFDIKNREEIEYSSEYFFINKLAVNFNPQASDYPTIKKIFSEIVGEDDSITLLEIIAYSFWRAYPYPKSFILYGSGGNGKTAFIKILERVLGRRNISLQNSNDLLYSRFSTGRLYGKLINVTSEMAYSLLKDTSRLKMLTGEDPVECERKFKEPFSFTNYAKCIFISNQIPLTYDKTFAFYRRIFLLEFPNKYILGENANPDIIDNIDQVEIEGLAFWALAKLGELMKNKFVFSKHTKTEKVTEQYEDLSNPLAKFIKEFTVKEVNSEIPKNEFLDRFVSYLQDKGFRVWSDKEVAREMRRMGYTEKNIASGPAGDQTVKRCWIELFWK